MSTFPKTRFLDRTTPPHIATLILMAAVGALSLNVFLPSLPSMADHFGVDYGLMQLSVSAYLATTAVVQVAIGPFSDRYGRRPVMIGTVLVFTIASVGAIYAPNFTVFLIFRLLQTAIATSFVISRAVVRDMVPQDQAASMIGYVTMGMSIVPMIGPAVGGILDEAFGWQASFWMLAGGGLLLFMTLYFDQGETFAKREGGFAAQVREYPKLLTSQRFWGYCLAAAFASGAFFAYLGGAPFVGTVVFAMEPAELGLYFGAPAVGYLIGNGLSGRYSVRVGVNRMVLIGTLLTVAGMSMLMLLDLAGFSHPFIFFGFMIFIGLGNGILLPSANAGMLSVRPALAGSAAGLGGAFMIGGGAALSVIAGFILGPGTGARPLIILMLLTTLASVVCALWVMRRAAVVDDAT
ncbi:putative major facilitator superfamily [MFS] transporter [Octadecabacter antarcticus 307]|uniref:Bcr/CflA family efflux transporter n=1 Tax=Octadecabacter antarcticus 307 TaxID=391626 RepID=M9R2G3_9RHOB|nr:multidrug effflux MFS transporter [Octadecabacter antarcticus]AGI66844.1 putative major facilitator superfamily [MFS] transporter [Octadecabacter antarcticus 307]